MPKNRDLLQFLEYLNYSSENTSINDNNPTISKNKMEQSVKSQSQNTNFVEIPVHHESSNNHEYDFLKFNL